MRAREVPGSDEPVEVYSMCGGQVLDVRDRSDHRIRVHQLRSRSLSEYKGRGIVYYMRTRKVPGGDQTGSMQKLFQWAIPERKGDNIMYILRAWQISNRRRKVLVYYMRDWKVPRIGKADLLHQMCVGQVLLVRDGSEYCSCVHQLRSRSISKSARRLNGMQAKYMQFWGVCFKHREGWLH